MPDVDASTLAPACLPPSPQVGVCIVDTRLRMDHEDLMANDAGGWNRHVPAERLLAGIPGSGSRAATSHVWLRLR